MKEKYDIKKAYYFIGFIESNEILYKFLQECGFVLIFKPTLRGPEGKVKGNCDAELVLQAMIDYKEYDKAVIVTGDGDFTCLVKYFIEKGKLRKLLVPNQKRYSSLLKKMPSGYIAFVSDLKNKLKYSKNSHKKEKNPVRTKP